MNTRKIKIPNNSWAQVFREFKIIPLTPALLFVLLLMLWPVLPVGLRSIDYRIGSVDQSIWQLVLLSVISFMLICGLSWWLLQRVWTGLGLPPLSLMVSHFNTLSLWHQLGFYWASFVALLLAASCSLIAIC